MESLLSEPADFVHPITQRLFVDPVVAADGQFYEREVIEEWFEKGNRISPLRREILESTSLISNVRLNAIIEGYMDKLPSPQREEQMKIAEEERQAKKPKQFKVNPKL